MSAWWWWCVYSPVNICVKATAIANGYLVNDNISLVVVPQFREVR